MKNKNVTVSKNFGNVVKLVIGNVLSCSGLDSVVVVVIVMLIVIDVVLMVEIIVMLFILCNYDSAIMSGSTSASMFVVVGDVLNVFILSVGIIIFIVFVMKIK